MRALDRNRRRVVIVAGLLTLSVLAGVTFSRPMDDGPSLHTIAVGRYPWALAVDTPARRAFVLDRDAGTVNVLDTLHLRLLRTVAVNRTPLSVAVDPLSGHVFVLSGGASAGSVAMLDAHSGTVLRTITAGTGSIALAVDTLTSRGFVLNFGSNSMSVFDTRTGRPLPPVAPVAEPGALAVATRTGRVFVTMGGAIASGGPAAVSMLVLDATGGAVRRRVGLPGNPALLVVDDAHGYVFAVDRLSGTVTVLDSASGSPRGMIAVSRAYRSAFWPVYLAMAAVDSRTGRLFVVNSAGSVTGGRTAGATVVTIEGRTRRIVRTVSIGVDPGAMAVDARRGQVYVAVRGILDTTSGLPVAQGSIIILDAHRGAVLRTVTVGVDPFALAVDDATGRLFVATLGGTVRLPAPDPWGWVPGPVRRLLPFLAPPPPRTQTFPPNITVLDVAPSA